MSQLDEVSYNIGELKGEVESLNKNVERLITWVTKHADEDKEKFEALDKRVGKFEKFKVRVYAVAGFCSFIITLLINYLSGGSPSKPHGL